MSASVQTPGEWWVFECAHEHRFAVRAAEDLFRMGCAICGTITVRRLADLTPLTARESRVIYNSLPPHAEPVSRSDEPHYLSAIAKLKAAAQEASA